MIEMPQRSHPEINGEYNMRENDAGTDDIPAQKKGRKTLNDRLGHIGNAFRELKQAPVLAGIIGISGLAGSLLLGEVFSDVYGKMNPLGIENMAEILTQDLIRKSENIEEKVVEISGLLLQMQSGDVQDPEALQGKISELLESINGIRPNLSEVVSLRNDMFLAAARQKDYDIAMVNMSPIPDVMIKMNDGVTLCKERYTLAIDNSGNPRTTSPRITLTSPTGESFFVNQARVGEPIIVDDNLGRIVVVYQAHEVIANEAFYGFDLNCPT
jgi:hypothetical protein